MANKILTPRKFKVKQFKDQRGILFELNRLPGNNKFKNEILTFSKKNVLRGIHYKKNYENKLVIVLKGKILDFCIQLKRKLPIKIFKFNLKKGEGLFIPKGFAHGYLCKGNENIILYKLSTKYNKKLEKGIIWNDKTLKLDWKLKKPILSEKDKKFKKLLIR